MPQIWIDMCMYLLLSYVKFLNRTVWSLGKIICILRLNMFKRRPLNDLFRDPKIYRNTLPNWNRSSPGIGLMGQQLFLTACHGCSGFRPILVPIDYPVVPPASIRTFVK